MYRKNPVRITITNHKSMQSTRINSIDDENPATILTYTAYNYINTKAIKIVNEYILNQGIKEIMTTADTEKKKILDHHHHHRAPFIYDLSLMKKLMNVWLAILFLGFLFDTSYQYFHNTKLLTFLPTFSTSFAPRTKDEEGWTHLESHGDIELSYRTIVPTNGLHAHRAVTVVDLPIEALLHVFRDTPNNVSSFVHIRIISSSCCGIFFVAVSYTYIYHVLILGQMGQQS